MQTWLNLFYIDPMCITKKIFLIDPEKLFDIDQIFHYAFDWNFAGTSLKLFGSIVPSQQLL